MHSVVCNNIATVQAQGKAQAFENANNKEQISHTLHLSHVTHVFLC